MKRSSWAQSHYDHIKNDPEYLAARVMIEVNEQIVQRMEELAISQHELARRIGITQPALSRLLNHGTNVTMRTLVKIAVALEFNSGRTTETTLYSHDSVVPMGLNLFSYLCSHQ